MRNLSVVCLLMVGAAAVQAGPSALDGVWLDPAGGAFTVKSGNGRFAWIGQGAKDGKYYLQKGAGTVQDNTLSGNWVDLPESQFYPGQGTVTGTLAPDGQSIVWRHSAGLYQKWVRHIGPAPLTGRAPALPDVTPSVSVNLVRSGGFEGAFGPPWGVGQYGANGIWWNSGNCGSTAALDSQISHGGRASLHIVNPTARGPNIYGTTVQRIPVEPNRDYRVTLWARGRNLASNGAVSIIVDPSWRIRPLHLPAGTFEWQKFEGTFRMAASFAEFRIISEDRGEVWIDDVSVTPATP